jgi:prepilin-type N-terminal cleavage/methylation domain-containing protein
MRGKGIVKHTKEEIMNKKGFTLIELIIVVIIIGILAAVAVPQYLKAVERAKMATAISNLRILADAQKVYRAREDVYATTAANLKNSDVDIDEVLAQNGKDFTFSVAAAAATTFTVQAARTAGKGPCAGVMTLNQIGTLTGAYKACVDGL